MLPLKKYFAYFHESPETADYRVGAFNQSHCSMFYDNPLYCYGWCYFMTIHLSMQKTVNDNVFNA